MVQGDLPRGISMWRICVITANGNEYYSDKVFETQKEAKAELEETLGETSYIEDSKLICGRIEED